MLCLQILEPLYNADGNFGFAGVLPPYSIVDAASLCWFPDAGDLESALDWFHVACAGDVKPVLEHLLLRLVCDAVGCPDQALWNSVIEKLLGHGRLNLMVLQEAAVL